MLIYKVVDYIHVYLYTHCTRESSRGQPSDPVHTRRRWRVWTSRRERRNALMAVLSPTRGTGNPQRSVSAAAASTASVHGPYTSGLLPRRRRRPGMLSSQSRLCIGSVKLPPPSKERARSGTAQRVCLIIIGLLSPYLSFDDVPTFTRHDTPLPSGNHAIIKIF